MSQSIALAGLIGRKDWSDIVWQAFRPGVQIHWLYRTGENGPAAALLRYEAGASVPLHEHPGWEHIFVLSGAQSDGVTRHAEGALMLSAPGTRHAINSDEGCVVLAIWNRPVRIIDDSNPDDRPRSPQ
jgi:anti-sigma factor ChrR (cupin superfamily)